MSTNHTYKVIKIFDNLIEFLSVLLKYCYEIWFQNFTFPIPSNFAKFSMNEEAYIMHKLENYARAK